MKPTRRLALALLLAAGMACVAAGAGGCATWPNGDPVIPGTKADPQSVQQQLDQSRIAFGAVMDFLQPLIDGDVIKDKAALAVIRSGVIQGSDGIKKAQASIDAGQQLTAGFYVDQVAAAVKSLERVQSKQKGGK